MDEFLNKMAELMLGRVEGPLHFRLVLQPVMAVLLAVRDGRADAKAGKKPYFWTLLSEPDQRRERLRDGWKSISKVFLLALVLDMAYQFLVMPAVHPFRAAIIAIILAIIPYLLIRGLITRLINGVRPK